MHLVIQCRIQNGGSDQNALSSPHTPVAHASSGHPAWLRAAPFIFLVLWSGGFIALKFGLAYADPLTFLALRYLLVVLLLALPFAILRPPLPATRSAWINLAVVALLVQAGYFAFTYLSLALGMSAGVVAVITSQQPILVGLLAPLTVGERVDRQRWAGLVLGVAGAVIVILSRTSSVALTGPSLVCAVLAVFCMTGGTLWERRHGVDIHPLTSNIVQYGVGFLATAPLALALEPMRIEWTSGMFWSLAYLIVCNSLISITLLLAMVRRGEASRVSALFFLVPPTAAVFAWHFLDEPLPLMAWPGMALTAAGIYLVMKKTAPLKASGPR